MLTKEESNPYKYRKPSPYSPWGHYEELTRLKDLICVGDLVRIEPIMSPAERGFFSVDLETEEHKNEVGVITKKCLTGYSEYLYSVLLGSGFLLKQVHILDFVVIQPVEQQEK